VAKLGINLLLPDASGGIPVKKKTTKVTLRAHLKKLPSLFRIKAATITTLLDSTLDTICITVILYSLHKYHPKEE
jgi:hypothetical protein